jgi:hypothetical protein
LNTRVELRLRCRTREAGRQLGAVLAPDNTGAPRGLALSMSSKEGMVSFDLDSESPSTALSTTMAILRDVSLFEQVWLLSRAHDGWQPGTTRE